MTSKWSSEAELAATVVSWFREQDFEVYQEVKCYSRCADLVVTRGPITAVVEVKLSLSLAVLEQCHYWRALANAVWAAAPRSRSFGTIVARQFGIGVLEVGLASDYQHRKVVDVATIQESVAPEWRRRQPDGLRAHLVPEQATGKYAAAGVQIGQRYSAFRRTCEELRALVAARPGIQMAAAVREIAHHYATPTSARGALAHWIEKGKVPGVSCRREGRHLLLYPPP